MPYIYEGQVFCDRCGYALVRLLHLDTRKDPLTVREIDQDTMISNRPEHCQNGADCFSPVRMKTGAQIGAWLRNKLTPQGEEFVKETMRKSEPLRELWTSYYPELDIRKL